MNEPALTTEEQSVTTFPDPVNLVGGAFSTNGVFLWGPHGGYGEFTINPGGSSYFLPFYNSAQRGFGFGKSREIVSPVDIFASTYAPGLATSRTDDDPMILNGLSTAHYDTTEHAIRAPAIFIDVSLIKTAGSNHLTAVGIRTDIRTNAPGADTGVSWWNDRGEFWNSGNEMQVNRPGVHSPPSVSGCGGWGAFATGTNAGFEITLGPNAAVSCTLVLQDGGFRDHAGLPTKARCLVQSPSGVSITWATTATMLTIFSSSFLSGTFIGKCWGTDDSIP